MAQADLLGLLSFPVEVLLILPYEMLSCLSTYEL